MKKFLRDNMYKDIAEQLNEKIFSFDDFILPEEMNIDFRDIVMRMANRIRDSKNSGQREDQTEQMGELFKKISQKLIECGAKMQAFVYSSGGSTGKNKDNTLADRLNKNNAKTEYYIFSIPNKIDDSEIIVLEAIGQKNNATFIGKKQEGLEQAINNLGRTGIVKSGMLHRIIHDQSGDKKGYNFESEHILKIIDCAHNYPDELLETVEKNNGCSLNTVLTNIKYKVSVDSACRQKGIALNENNNSVSNEQDQVDDVIER